MFNYESTMRSPCLNLAILSLWLVMTGHSAHAQATQANQATRPRGGMSGDIVEVTNASQRLFLAAIPTDVLVDLLWSDADDILQDLDEADRVLELNPTNRVAQLQRALALEAFGVKDERETFWRRVEDNPETSDWADDAQLVRANMFVRGNAASAALLLDSLVASFAMRRLPLRLVPALVLRCESRLAQSQIEAAAADLDSSAAVLSRIGAARRPPGLLTAIGISYHKLAMWHIGAGQPKLALLQLERGRTAFHPSALPSTISERPHLPKGHVAIEYALIGDTLLSWVIKGNSVRFSRRTVSQGRLLNTIAALRSSLDQPGIQTRIPRTLERVYNELIVPAEKHQQELYDLLIRPIEHELGESGSTITIISDGELKDIPFAALHDKRRQRFLVQDHTIRFARSWREGLGTRLLAEGPGKNMLLVSDPAFDRRFYPAFARLHGARAEVDTIAAEHGAAVVLRGEGAHYGSVLGVLQGAEILHYAGHAVHDREHPERSFLVLADARGYVGSGRLAAAQLEKLDLRHVRLVVLAACETFRSRSGWSAGLPGLTDAFLNAGAAGVVGSLWRVDDDHTRRLMIRFHRAYRRSRDGPAALRSAQLEFLSSDDPSVRSPAAWAGFQYMGR